MQRRGGVEDGVLGQRVRCRGGEGKGEAGEERGGDGRDDGGGNAGAVREATRSQNGTAGRTRSQRKSRSQLVFASELSTIDAVHEKTVQEVRGARHRVVRSLHGSATTREIRRVEPLRRSPRPTSTFPA